MNAGPMSTTVATLREAAWTDIPALAVLDATLFAADAWSAQTWWAEFAGRPRRSYAVLAAPSPTVPEPEEPGVGSERILGYAGLDLGGEVADVMTIAVAGDARGAGHGLRLVDWLVATARESGARHLMLEVRSDNAAALALYGRAGFTRISVRRRYYQPGDIDAVIMRKELGS